MYDGIRKDAISKNKMEAEQKRLAAEEKRTRMREHRAQEKGKLISMITKAKNEDGTEASAE